MKESRFQGDPGLTRSIRTVTDGIAERLADGAPSVYLYGSAALRLIGCEALKDSYVRLRYEVLREHTDLSATGKGGEKA